MVNKKVKGPYQGVYEGMDFPEYKYERYPLMVTGNDPSKGAANQHVVHNAEEEDAAVKAGWSVPEKIGAPVTLTGDEIKRKDAYITELEAKLAAASPVVKAVEPVKPVAPVAAAKPVAPVAPAVVPPAK